ncbi:hypothetical protein C7H84_29095 [Burkholderia sp. Nafp2/4-1b]|nr:hypothetical protein C7H84_29095 [Burkholderia sp. Nafp2/4-1b]
MRALYVFFMTMPCRIRTLRSFRLRVRPDPTGVARCLPHRQRVCHASVLRPGNGRRCSDSS